MEKPCEHCGSSFRFKPSHLGRARFCSKTCLGVFNAKRLQNQREAFAALTGSRTFGVEVWAKTHAKGMHLSPGSEFRKGHKPANKMCIGAVTIRPDKEGHDRAWVKVSEPNGWRPRAIVVWEAIHGPLPPGHIVHHRDRDSLNDQIDNLAGMTRGQHANEHREEHLQIRRREVPRDQRASA